MAEHLMETTLRTALWYQFGAAIEMLEHALLDCPASLWHLRAYGPAIADDFAFWWGCGKTVAKNLFQSMEEELEDVEVEG